MPGVHDVSEEDNRFLLKLSICCVLLYKERHQACFYHILARVNRIRDRATGEQPIISVQAAFARLRWPPILAYTMLH